jgi:hypothetical protein
MLQASEIQQKFSHIQQTIGQAAQACKTEEGTSVQLKECIDKLSREAKQAGEVIRSNDPTRIRQCVDQLESISSEAKRVSRSGAKTPATLETVVTQVQSELSQLKQQLH